ncbi:MAG: hypothetical protein V3T13_00830, partial [Hyphomicrobium sp.]
GTRPGWSDQLLARRPTNVVLVAMANKTARGAWAVSVAAMGEQKCETPLPDNESLDVERIIALRRAGASEVREMPA